MKNKTVSKETIFSNKYDGSDLTKLLMSSYLFHYDYTNKKLINRPKQRMLRDFFNLMRHSHDYGIAPKFKVQVEKMYQSYGFESKTHEEGHQKNLGMILRADYFFKGTNKTSLELQDLYDDCLRKQSKLPFHQAKLQTCSNAILLFIVLIQFNKEILWNTSLQDYELEIDWQQEIVNKKGEDFLKDLRQGKNKLFAKRLHPSKRYNVCEWCTFLDYWLKHDNKQYPNFFTKLEFMMEIYPTILTRLREIYQFVCQKLEDFGVIWKDCQKDVQLENSHSDKIDKLKLRFADKEINKLSNYEKLKRQDKIYEAYKTGFNRDCQIIGESKIDELCADNNQMLEDIKYLSKSYDYGLQNQSVFKQCTQTALPALPALPASPTNNCNHHNNNNYNNDNDNNNNNNNNNYNDDEMKQMQCNRFALRPDDAYQDVADYDNTSNCDCSDYYVDNDAPKYYSAHFNCKFGYFNDLNDFQNGHNVDDVDDIANEDAFIRFKC